MNISFNLSHIIRFTLAIIASMVAGFWIGAAQCQPLDDKDLKAVKATIFVVIIATLPVATYMVLSLLI